MKDADRAQLVDAAIESLSDPITLEDASVVAQVRAAFDRLTTDEAASVTQLANLEAAEEALEALNVVPLEGEGTEASPYLIDDEADLAAFVSAANANLDDARTAHYLITADMLLTREVTMIAQFGGVLDGGGHTLAGLRLASGNTGSNKTLALIDSLMSNGVVKNIGLSDVQILGDSTAETQSTGTRRAAFVARNAGTVEQVYATGSISGAWRTGGIVADNVGGTVRNTWFEGNVEGSWETGGIVGRNGNEGNSVLEDSWASATSVTRNNNAGIISGYGYGSNNVTKFSTLHALVARDGSVTGNNNLGRISGQENSGSPAYSDLLVNEGILINNSTVNGGTRTNKQGESTSEALLSQQSTYEGIGWDFEDVWSWNPGTDAPALSGVPFRSPLDIGVPETSVETTVASPDGAIEVRLYTDESSALRYEVERDGEVVVEPSRLGLTIESVDWSRLVSLGEAETYEGSDDYELLGTQREVSDTHNGAIVPVSRAGESVMSIDVRVFNNGFAFRYALADDSAGDRVNREWTTVDVDQTSVINYQLVTAGTIDDMQNSWSRGVFEEVGTRQITVMPTVELAAGGYLNFAESNVRDWPALALQMTGTGELSTYYWATDSRDGTFKVSEDRLASPWRVVTLTEDLDTLTNASLVTTLADPVREDLFTEDWIKPGTSLWLANNGAGLRSTPETFFEFIDGAEELSIDYVLIEDMSQPEWGTTTADKFGHVKELADYGAERGVGVWVWTDYDNGNGIHDDFFTYEDTTGKDRDSLQNEVYRDAYLDFLVETGVSGVKIDHINEETETKVNLYADVDEATAKRKLHVIWHNPMGPTGLQRTYPNELVREAIRGFQSGYNATQNTIAPFTRLVNGTADYTPLSFTNTGLAGDATWAHQMASTVVYSAPYLQLSEIASTMVEGGAYSAILGDFVGVLPAVWESSSVLEESVIGNAAAVVRTTGDGEYWIAAQVAAGAAQSISVPLDFLPEGVEYTADAYRDGATAKQVDRTVSTVDSTDTLTADMRSGGGFVVRITLDEVEEPGEEGVFEISSEEDLELIRSHPTGEFRLTADIEMTQPFTPIQAFTGTLDGRGFEIRNLELAPATNGGSRAFILNNSGVVKRLGLASPVSERTGSFVSGEVTAALVATNSGSISESYVTNGRVSGGWRSALLVAENSGTISDSYATGSVRGNWETAGVAAWNSATAVVERSYADAEVDAAVQNAGVVTAYGYSGTVFDGLVALGGSVEMGNASPIGRISARENGTPTYSGGLSLETITLRGQTVSGSESDKNGRNVSSDALVDEATFTAIGWDFSNVWEMSEELQRPVLRANDERQSVMVEFDTAGGEPIEAVKVFGDVLPELPTPAREGYEFTGWSALTATGPIAVVSGDALEGLGNPVSLRAGWEVIAEAVDSIELTAAGGVTSVAQGGSLLFTVTAFDASGEVLDGADELVILTSDVETDVVEGMQVAFPHASPHVITATLIADASVNDSVQIEVVPAGQGSGGEQGGQDGNQGGDAGNGSTGGSSEDGLSVTGVALGGLLVLAIMLLLAGGVLVMARRRAHLG